MKLNYAASRCASKSEQRNFNILASSCNGNWEFFAAMTSTQSQEIIKWITSSVAQLSALWQMISHRVWKEFLRWEMKFIFLWKRKKAFLLDFSLISLPASRLWTFYYALFRIKYQKKEKSGDHKKESSNSSCYRLIDSDARDGDGCA